MHLSIIIPAFNEEQRIMNTLNNMEHYLRKSSYEWEIIIVDDGSEDETVKVITQNQQTIKQLRLIQNNQNSGKGFSVRRGMLEAKGDLVLFSDADFSTPIEEVEKLQKALEEGCDIAIGSRGLPQSNIELHQPFYREFMGRVFNTFVRALVLPDFSDTQCGFKCFKKEAAQKVCPLMKISGFAFDVEMLFLAKKFGFKIKEVPVRWLDSPQSRVHPVRHSLQMLKDILCIRWNKYE